LPGKVAFLGVLQYFTNVINIITANHLKSYLARQNIAGIEGLIADVQTDKPEIVFDVDRERANREGISTGQITQNFRYRGICAKAGDFQEYA